jgi:nucleoside-diphosphate-sugar epimerase
MRILITGTDGYIGCVLAPAVIDAGHEVVGLDTRYFDEALLGAPPRSGYPVIVKDVRDIAREDLEGIDAVMHLAGLSNDALGELSRRVTFDINHRATVRLATLCKDAGVERFIYSSSCSVYGKSSADIVTEETPFDPQTDYAVCKMLDERELSDLADESFSPTFLRNATAYGASPRMRFDLVVNNLSALAWTTRRIAMVSDGTPWRPIVHILDISRAFLAALAAPRHTVHNQVFNVGRTDENYQIREIATCVGDVFPGLRGDVRQERPGSAQLSRELRQDHPGAAGILMRVGSEGRDRATAHALRADGTVEDRLRASALHAHQAAASPAGGGSYRLGVLLDGSSAAKLRTSVPEAFYP